MNKTLALPENKNGRDFVVGDLHGHIDMLRELMGIVAFDQDIDRLFAVGDLIDRGPNSADCLRLVMEPWFYSAMGNHELMMLDAVSGEFPNAMSCWVMNGGGWWSGETENDQKELAAIASSLPIAIAVGSGVNRFNVLHAEFLGTDSDLDQVHLLDQHVHMQMLWGRSVVEGKQTPTHGQLSMTYVGHTIVRRPGTRANHGFIDTGSFLLGTGRLTMIEPSTGNIWQSNNK